MSGERPKPYKRMIAFVILALLVAAGLAGWYSYKVHPGDAKPAEAVSAPAG